jgi:excinuclease ABC subunit A
VGFDNGGPVSCGLQKGPELSVEQIQLRGVSVHNLRKVDVDIPLGKLVVVCGVSGSGKTSLALDTLYAEGQRRYIESFSAYMRQFLERLEKPAAERIENIPPAVAVTHKNSSRSSRSTIGTATETADYLRLLFAKVGEVRCLECGIEVRLDTPQSASDRLRELPTSVRFMVAAPQGTVRNGETGQRLQQLREAGFARAILGRQTVSLTDREPLGASPSPAVAMEANGQTPLYTVIDRLTSGEISDSRLRDSLETAFQAGGGSCAVFLLDDPRTLGNQRDLWASLGSAREIDGRRWWELALSGQRRCSRCGTSYPEPEPRLFSFNSPLGACPECEGFGNVMDIDMDLVVPDASKSLREGAIAPWNTPAYTHELQELLELADDHEIPVDVPFRELGAKHLELIREGVPERNFGGLRGFFAWLERRKYKMHLRVFLSRWRSYLECPQCHGSRLRREALAVRVGDRNLAEIMRMRIDEAHRFFRQLELTPHHRQVARIILDQILARLHYLEAVGVGYLTLDRTLRTLSGGEAQRVALTSALGSSLVNMLYVLDEPSVGLHPEDVEHLLRAIESLRDRGNTVVVIEHEEAVVRAADHLVEIGPGAGHRGGQVVFTGTLPEMLDSPDSLTGAFLSGRRGVATPANRRQPRQGWIKLTGARGNNLQGVTVEFPLGVLCLVTGVSGSGKSTLVQDTLYGAVCRRKRKDAPKPYPYDDVFGDGQIDDIVLVDQSPIGRSPRSNPVTYVKAFDPIRAVFAETIEARTHNYSAGYFSFNCDEGRCSECHGDGHIEIDMQFLADVFMKCSRCQGTRYRKEVLAITYRGCNIAEVLDMTVREAFAFFRGQPKVLSKLKPLLDVGLEYLRLGQPANTLSGGESQRLKLASYLSTARRRRTLFILDEPTTGLHFADVVQLMDCFEALLAVGHSLVVVEHNLQLMRAADYIIDLGPKAGEEGGRVVAQGSPEEVARCLESATGRWLASSLAVPVEGELAHDTD